MVLGVFFDTRKARGRRDAAEGGPDLAQALRSDRLYFEAGGHLTHTEDFTLATVPGFERLAAGNVGFLDRWPERGRALEACLRAIEGCFRAAGAAAVRFYAPEPDAGAHRQLAALGYSARAETMFRRRASAEDQASRLTMFPILTESNWARKLDLQRTSETPSDGHAADPADWVAFERFKCAHSGLTFQGFEDGGGMVATMGFLPLSPRVIRLKNLLVHADARGRGIAREVLRLSFHHAWERGADWLILFAVAGTSSDRLYRAAGSEVLGSVWECSRTLET